MASPFKAFRKNQTILIAVLIGLSMFAFILAQSINAENFPIFLGMALGAVGLWLLSNKGGTQGWMIAGVGGIVGGLLGAFAPAWWGRDAVILTDLGSLTQREASQISADQNAANEFMQRAFSHVLEKVPSKERLAMMRMRPDPFGFAALTALGAQEQNAVARSQRRNMAFTFLLGKKAEEMGITISDDAVRDYLTKALGEHFSQEIFTEVREGMQIGTSHLFDLLRQQLRVRTAYQILAPFRIRPALGIADPGPTSPTPQQLWASYKKLEIEAEANIATLPVAAFKSEVGKPTTQELQELFDKYSTRLPREPGPGFALPRRVQIAYLEILAGKVRDQVEKPSDEEVLAYYQAHKAMFDLSQKRMPPQTPGVTGPVEAPRPRTNGASTQVLETPPVEAPQPQTDGESSTRVGTPNGLVYVSTPTGMSEAGTQETAPVAAPRPKTIASDGQEPAPSSPSLPPLSAPKSSSQDSGPGDAPSEQILAMVRNELIAQRVRKALDERQEEARDAVTEIVDDVMTDLPPRPDSRQGAEVVAKYQTARKQAVTQLRKRLENLAKQQDDLTFVVTSALSREELATSDDYPIGQASQPRGGTSPFSRQSVTIAEIVFGSEPDRPMVPINARGLINQSRYVALKIADLPPDIPLFSDPGVEERVAEAWTKQRAQELARKRAQVLADMAGSTNDDLAAALKGRTVTGDESSESLRVESVGPFTWMSRSSVPARGMMLPTMQPSTLPEVPGAGAGFMRTVFEVASVGKATVAPSATGEEIYVVQVTSRTPETELAQARTEFMKEDFFSSIMGFPLSPFRREIVRQAGLEQNAWVNKFLLENGVVFAGGAAPETVMQ